MTNTWTRTPPAKAGWYWVSFGGSEPMPAHIDNERIVQFAIHEFRLGSASAFEKYILWSVKPITVPKLPQSIERQL